MYLECAKPEVILGKINELDLQPEEAVLLFIAEKSQPDLNALVSMLKAGNIRFLGGIFPGVIYGQLHMEGAVAVRVPSAGAPLLIQDLSRQVPLLSAGQVRTLQDIRDGNKQATGLILVDGLAPHISLLLNELHAASDHAVQYLGGGCGSLSLQPMPCLFTAEGVFQNAAAILPLSTQCLVGIQHGWRRLAGPFKATRTHQKILHELNGRPAFEVYREVVEKDAQRTLSPEDFFSIAKEYPFGMVQESDEDVVRDPIAVGPNGELICIGDVPENISLNILKGHKSALIAASGRAAGALCRKEAKIIQCLAFDCVSRSLYLDAAYTKELEMIHNSLHLLGANMTVKGALSLGEIASSLQHGLCFYNKTTVIGGLAS